MLLPQMFTAEQSPDALVAIQRGTPPRLAGAAASGTVHAPNALGFPFWLHVVPAFRRRGVGRGLLAAVAGHCRGRTPVLRALQPVPAGSRDAEFLTACGFTDFDEIRHFETGTRDFNTAMLRLCQKLERRGAIPATARVVRLRDAPADRVLSLIVAHFPGPLAPLRARLTPGQADSYDLDNSVAVMVGEQLAGVLINIWHGPVAVIELRIVNPAFRGSWVMPLLLEAATRNGMDAGCTLFRFFADTANADTMRLAARAGADLIKVERRFWRRLE